MSIDLYLSTGIKKTLIEEIIAYAIQFEVEKLVLFGSRARGDYQRTSDIDLAFFGGQSSRFILAVSEDTRTLLEFDIVDLSGIVQQELRESIEKEGIVIYEKV